MKWMRLAGIAAVVALAACNIATAALWDNWLSLIIQKRLQEPFPDDGLRVAKIVQDIRNEPKAKEFAEKPNLNDAVQAGVLAAHERQKNLTQVPIGPTPAQAGAVKICAILMLPYPPFDTPPNK